MSDFLNPPRDGEGDRDAQRRGGGGSPELRHPATYTARRLRREMTLPEVLLWEQLRGKKAGPKFRRQHRIGNYVADFYCSPARLVVEIDGFAHNTGDRPERDETRDTFLRANGYTVLRLPASEVLADVDAAAESIVRAASPLHHPAGGPPPRAGEDL